MKRHSFFHRWFRLHVPGSPAWRYGTRLRVWQSARSIAQSRVRP